MKVSYRLSLNFYFTELFSKVIVIPNDEGLLIKSVFEQVMMVQEPLVLDVGHFCVFMNYIILF